MNSHNKWISDQTCFQVLHSGYPINIHDSNLLGCHNENTHIPFLLYRLIDKHPLYNKWVADQKCFHVLSSVYQIDMNNATMLE